MVLALIFLIASGWGFLKITRYLLGSGLGYGWRIAFWPTAILGATLGVWSGMFLEYQPKPGMRVLGFPIPVAAFVLENGQGWTDFVPSPAVQWIGIFTNVVLAMAAALGFLATLARFPSRLRAAASSHVAGE